MSSSAPPNSILLADDDEGVLAATGALLRRQGYDVDCVPSGSAAAERIGAKRYDLVILDLHMPGNRELELVRAHGDTDRLSGVPIMIMTGNPSVSTAIEAMRHSVLDYVTKPCAPDVLLARVKSAIEKAQNLQTLTGVQSHLSALQELVDGLVDRHHDSPASGRKRAEMALSEQERGLLSTRELEVLTEVAGGSGTAAIAETLFISPHTVRNHLKAIYRKLEVSSRSELMKKLLTP